MWPAWLVLIACADPVAEALDGEPIDEPSVVDARALSVRLVAAPESLSVGESVQLEVLTLRGEEAVTGVQLRFTSSHPATVLVSEDGRVTGLADGTAWVTVEGESSAAMVEMSVHP